MTFTDDAVGAVLYGTDATEIETDEAAIGSEQTIVWNAPAPATPVQVEYDAYTSNFDALNATTGTFFISLEDLRLALDDPGLTATDQQRTNTRVVAISGHGKVLRQVMPANYYGFSGGAGAYYFAELQTEDPIDEVRIRYDIQVHSGDGIDWGKGVKLPGLGGVNDHILPTRVVGSNGGSRHGWSTRLGWNTATSQPAATSSPNELIGYRYRPDQPQDWGETLHTNHPLTGNAWHTVEQYVKMNDVVDGVAVANGVHEIVIDGTLVYTASDVIWRVRDDVHVTHVFWHVYRGGDRGADSSDYAVHSQDLIDFDNLQITGFNGGATGASTVWTTDLLTWALDSDLFVTRVEIHDATDGPALRSVDVGEFASGSYSLTLDWDSSDASLVLEGSAAADNADMVIAVLDTDLVRAPTSATVVLAGGWPNTNVDFYIDGGYITTLYTDEDGCIAASSIDVPEPLGAGTHTITAQQENSADATATFNLKDDPNLALVAIGQDAMPVQVADTLRPNGTRRWVLQDLLPGGLGSWVMPRNPTGMSSPYVDNALASKHTTARSGGQFHVTQGGTIPRDWSFSGEIFSKEEYLQLEAYRNLNRRFYIIDHRNRAWICVITDIAWTNHLQTNFDGEQTDWAADYEVSVTTFSQTYRNPQ